MRVREYGVVIVVVHNDWLGVYFDDVEFTFRVVFLGVPSDASVFDLFDPVGRLIER